MIIQDVKKKKDFRKNCVLFIGMLVLFVFPAGASKKPKISIGGYGGWSFGLGEVFLDESPGGHTSNHYMPNFVLGVYGQWNFSEWFGLQLSANYQNCSKHWEFSTFDRFEEGDESVGSYSFSLNGVLNLVRSPMFKFYVLGGIGLFTGPFDYQRCFFQFCGGTGIKFRVQPEARMFVTLAALFHHFLYEYGGASNGDYLKLQAGLEFPILQK